MLEVPCQWKKVLGPPLSQLGHRRQLLRKGRGPLERTATAGDAVMTGYLLPAALPVTCLWQCEHLLSAVGVDRKHPALLV